MSTASSPLSTLAPPPEAAQILVASDNPGFRQHMLDLLAGARQRGVEALGGADALMQLELAPCAGLVLDRRLPDLDPDELAGMLAAQYPALEVEILDSAAPPPQLRRRLTDAAPSDFRGLMEALRRAKPEPPNGIERRQSVVRPILAAAESARAPLAPQATLELLPGLVGRSAHLGDISSLVRMVAPRRTTVLLLGETGTGKELIAQGIHQTGSRAQRPFVVVNCAAIPEALLESELFGYVRGAFTGAAQSRPGRIVAAHTGTLFLDEIGELPLVLQSKLLRFLQEGELQRLGSNDPLKVDVRVVAATNVNLMAEVEAGRFRRDLYYRLAVFPIELLPLRSRPEDVLPLAQHFLAQLQAETGAPRAAAAPAGGLAPDTAALLRAYPWNGNVRELQHSLERAFILAAGRPLAPEHFPVPQAWLAAQRFGPSRAE